MGWGAAVAAFAAGCGDTDGRSALITLSIESGEEGSLESLSRSSVSGLNSSRDNNFGTTGAAAALLVEACRRSIG